MKKVDKDGTDFKILRTERYVKYSRSKNIIWNLLYWTDILAITRDNVQPRIMIHAIYLFFAIVIFERLLLSFYCSDGGLYLRISLLHQLSHVISFFIWYSLRRKRNLLTKLLKLFRMRYSFSPIKLKVLVLVYIFSMLLVFPLTDVLKILLDRPYLWNIYCETWKFEVKLHTEMIVIAIKAIPRACIYPIWTNLVVMLYCLLCQDICRRLKDLTNEVENCSFKEFTVPKQADILKRKSEIVDLVNFMQNVFSIPSFLIFVAHFYACITVLGFFFVKNAIELSYPSTFAIIVYSSNSVCGLTACLWLAGGIPTAADELVKTIRRKVRRRQFCVKNADENCLDKDLTENSEFVLSGCGILPFHRSSILALAGTILTYTIFLRSRQ